MQYIPGKGSSALVPAAVGAGAAVLPVTGASWAVPAAVAVAAVLVFWGVLYFVAHRKSN